MINVTKYLICLAAGVIVGLVVYDRFLKPETETIIEYRETTVTDTLIVTVRDSIFVPTEKLKYIYLRDTIWQGQNLPIREYKGFEPTLYGNIGYQSQVAGEMLNMRLFSDLNIPTITNTITKETTKTIVQKPSGIYATGGIDTDFNYRLGAVYLNDKTLIGYEHNFPLKTHSLKVGYKIF